MCKFESLQKTKADGSRLIPRKHTETLVVLSVACLHGAFHCGQIVAFYLLSHA